MSLASEALCLVRGVFPEGPILKSEGAAAAALPGVYRRAIGKFLDNEPFEAFTYYPIPPFEKTLEKLIADIPIEEAERMGAKLEDGAFLEDYLTTLRNVRGYLRGIWPALQLDTVRGPQLIDPGPDRMGRAASIFVVCDRADRFVDEINASTLTTPQIDAFKTCFPAVFDMIREFLRVGIEKRAAASSEWNLDHGHELVLRRLLGLSQASPVSQIQQPESAMGPTDTASIDIDFKDLETKQQRLENK